MLKLKVERLDDGRLMATRDGDTPVYVQALRCFPWSEPDCYISLRGDDEKEVAIIADLNELDPTSREAVLAGLAETTFVFEVEKVESVEAEFEIRNWKVQTRQGPMTFQTRLDDWPRETPGGGLLFRDVSGNFYHFTNPRAMDEASRRLIWGFVD